ncbi:hypothetical protein [uncultured Methylobacterium sp.]|uniref:hypothetical protein n=1 Tax=uncultured Methylobacterium sp. TaxID=157278 RepID=UPI0035CC0407
MTSQDIERRLHGLCLLADRYRQPGPRRTTETCMIEFEEIRDTARRLYRELTGSWPRHAGDGEAPPARRPTPAAPSAVLRDRERRRASAQRA